MLTKKTPHLLELFLPWSYFCEFLRLRWEIDIIGEMRSWTLSWCVWFVFIFIHLKRYRCVSENGTLCSQSRLIISHVTFQIFFICAKFQWWGLFCKKFFEKIWIFNCIFELSTTVCFWDLIHIFSRQSVSEATYITTIKN